MSRLTLFRTATTPEEADVPSIVVAGDPRTVYRVIATGEGGRLSAGVWRGTVGAWRVRYDEWEFCHVLAGRARLCEDGAPPVEVGPGDSFTLAPGFAGVWDVVEPLVKHFVILDPPA